MLSGMSNAPQQRPSIFEDPEGYLEDFQRRTSTMRDKAQDLQHAMSEAKGIGVSDEEEVTVTVNVSGGLEDIQFSNEVRHLGADSLRTLVLEAYQRGRQQAGERMDEVMSSLLDADSESLAVYRNARQQHGGGA